MKTIEFKSNYGAFAYRITAEVGEELTPATEWLCQEQGLANIGYRIVGSDVDKALGVKSVKQGGTGRGGVLYSSEDSERINAAVSKKLTELEGKDPILKALKISFAVLGEHVGGDSNPAATKEAKDLWTAVQAFVPEERFKTALAKLKLDPENYTDEQGVAACHRSLLEAKRAAVAAQKAALGL